MSLQPKRIFLDEADARCLVWAEAVEQADTDGRLLDAVARGDVERMALQSVYRPPGTAQTSADALQAFLVERARRIASLAEKRQPSLACLGSSPLASGWLALAALLLAMLLGAAGDRMANPHRLDLLSLPLLAVVVWNLVVYSLLVASWAGRLRPRPAGSARRMRPTPAWLRWMYGLGFWPTRAVPLAAAVAAAFAQRWLGLTAPLQAQRGRKLLHLAAAGWAVGICLSLFTRGLVVEYRVGWESTFLQAGQVHAVLQVLLLPALALFPFDSFSLRDVAALRFDQGISSGAVAGARWVLLYAALLGLVVVVPRVLLAAAAGWRERQLSRRLQIDLSGDHYQRLVQLLHPAHMVLGLAALRDADAAAVLKMLQPWAGYGLPGQTGLPLPADRPPVPEHRLAQTATGETLAIRQLAPGSLVHQANAPIAPANGQGMGWLHRARSKLAVIDRSVDTGYTGNQHQAAETSPPAAATVHDSTGMADDTDALLIAVRGPDDLDRLAPALVAGTLPALVLLLGSWQAADLEPVSEAALLRCRDRARRTGLHAEVVAVAVDFATWTQDRALLGAVSRCLAGHRQAAFSRLAGAWRDARESVCTQAAELLARHLLEAAGDVQAVGQAPGALPAVRRLVGTPGGQADRDLLQAAAAELAARLQQATGQHWQQTLELFGCNTAPASGGNVSTGPWSAAGSGMAQADWFNVQRPLTAAQAGLAGMATGAASGASIDLMTGGLTLGAAAALGGLVGGSAALAGVHWKSRSGESAPLHLHASDGLMHELAVAGLVRCLAAAQLARGGDLPGFDRCHADCMKQAAAVLQTQHDALASYWQAARALPADGRLSAQERLSNQASSAPGSASLSALLLAILRPLLEPPSSAALASGPGPTE